MKILGVIGQPSYCEWWRIIWPFAELSRHGITADVCTYDQLRQIPIGAYDVIVTPRVSFPRDHWLWAYLCLAQKAGMKWVYEADDDLWSDEFVARQSEATSATDRGERRRVKARCIAEREQRLNILRQCDRITVSGQALADQVRWLTKTPIKVVPNAIDISQFERGYRSYGRMIRGLTIGWTGGYRRESDLELLALVWAELARRYPELTFVVYGYEPPILVNAVPVEQIAVVEWTTIDRYPAGLKNFDIGCCVLPNSPWNAWKSPNKWFELAMANVSCVVSPTVYGQVVGETALIADHVESWITQLERLIQAPELRIQLAEQARTKVVEQHSLTRNWTNWYNAYQGE